MCRQHPKEEMPASIAPRADPTGKVWITLAPTHSQRAIADSDGDRAMLSGAGASRTQRERCWTSRSIARDPPGRERWQPSSPPPRVNSIRSSATTSAPRVVPRRQARHIRRGTRGAHHEHRQRDGQTLRQARAQPRLPRGVRLHRRRRLEHPLGGLRWSRRRRWRRERPDALPRGGRGRAARRDRAQDRPRPRARPQEGRRAPVGGQGRRRG